MATGKFRDEQEKVWNGWLIEELIGEGSYGKVYKISRTERGRKYFSAVKMITIPTKAQYKEAVDSLGTDENSLRNYFTDMIDEIIDEVTILYSLAGYSNILGYFDHKIIDHGDDIGWDILIRMEYVKSLRKHLSEKQMTRGDVVKLGIDICNALELCSKKGIVHRDIKDENIFVNNEGIYKLGDFGIAKIVSQNRSMASMRGTPLYMAPEVYKGIKYDARIDIYSLGLVLYKLLNNDRMPFLPDYPQPIRFRDNEKAISMRLSGEAMPPPVNAGESLGKVVLKACETNPEDRYSSAQEFKKKLAAVYSDMEENSRNELVTLISDKKIHKKQHTDRTESILTDKSKKTERAVKPSESSGKTEAIHYKLVRKKDKKKKINRQKKTRKKNTRKRKILVLLLNIAVIALISAAIIYVSMNWDDIWPEPTTAPPTKTPPPQVSQDPSRFFIFDESTGTINGYYSIGGPDVVIPPDINGIPVTKIGDDSFDNKGLTSVTIPETVTEIGNDAFAYNNLTSIKLYDSLISIGYHAFAHNNITSLDLPDNLKEIRYGCFGENELNSIAIPMGILHIEGEAFINNNIEYISLPESLISIEGLAFAGNQVAKIDILSENVTMEDGILGDYYNNSFRDAYHNALNGGPGIYSGTQDGFWVKGDVYYTPESYFTFFNDTILEYNPDGGSDVVIPSGIYGQAVTKIGDFAFSERGITSVSIPDTVTEIGYAAFDLNSISEIYLSDSIVSIGEFAFVGNHLTSLELPAYLETIPFGCFAGNQLSSISFPSGLKYIGEQAFVDNHLETITLPESLLYIGQLAFAHNNLSHIIIMNGDTDIDHGMMGDYSDTESERLYILDNNQFRDAYDNETNGGAGIYSGSQDGEWTKTTDY